MVRATLVADLSVIASASAEPNEEGGYVAGGTTCQAHPTNELESKDDPTIFLFSVRPRIDKEY